MTNLAWLAALLMTACAVDSTGDGKDDSFLADGKSDGTISEGSAEAIGVLRVVNELTQLQLAVAVDIDDKAAHAIDAYRTNDWGFMAPARSIDTLAQLDAIDFVGPETYEKLLAFARDRGYLNTPAAFTPLQCTPMSSSGAAALVGHSATATFHTRQRDTCADNKCSDWRDGSIPLIHLNYVGEPPDNTQYPVPATATATVEAKDGWYRISLASGDIDVGCSNFASPGSSPKTAADGRENCGARVKLADRFETLFYDYRQQTGGTNDDIALGFLGRVCDDGRFQILSRLGFERDSRGTLKNVTNNWNQIAIEGAF